MLICRSEHAMTRFAKPLLLETPCCKQKVMQQRFASLNSFGLATAWSDGYTSMPFVSEASRLAYCPSCNMTYWLEDATVLGVVPSFDDAPTRRQRWLPQFLRKDSGQTSREAEAQVEPCELDYVDFHKHPRPADLLLVMLREEWSSEERELYLRTRLWWIGNHGQRGRRMLSPMSDEQANENIWRLLALHQTAPSSDHNAELIAELLRQMGRFDEAIAALHDCHASSAKSKVIEMAAAQGESKVLEVETF